MRFTVNYIRVKWYRTPFCVDTETELLIQNRTAIIVAHRLSTVQFVDRILVIHRGRIREEGTHDELLARQGLYYRLHQLQYQLS